MGSESQEKIQSIATREKRVLILIMAICLMSLSLSPTFRDSLLISSQNDQQEQDVLFVPTTLQNRHNVLQSQKEAASATIATTATTQGDANYFNVLSSYQNTCNASPMTPSSSSSTTSTTNAKPIWMPMLPFTISDSLHKDLINPMTYTSHGAKSFYSSIRGKLRHCISISSSNNDKNASTTVTCLNVHPSVEMTKGMPDSKFNDFSPHYLMILRNPMTVLPAGYNAKAAKYSGVVGQIPEEEWQRVREEWFDGMLEAWEKLIVTWKKTEKYSVGMYLVYEDLFDWNTGIETMKKLRNFLSKEGFSVVPEGELGCILFRAVGRDNLERFQKRRYEYDDYIPGFTMEQKDKMIKALRRIKQEFKDDIELVLILDRYIDDIENNIKIDG